MTEEVQSELVEQPQTFEERVAMFEAYIVKYAGTNKEVRARDALKVLLERGSLL